MTAGIPAVLKEITPSATVYYYREPGGALLARQEGTTGSTRRYYHFDGLGSTSMLTNTSGDWTDKYSYDGWGNVLQHGPSLLATKTDSNWMGTHEPSARLVPSSGTLQESQDTRPDSEAAHIQPLGGTPDKGDDPVIYPDTFHLGLSQGKTARLKAPLH